MQVLLTGGTGFIGTHVVRALAARGDRCVVISRSGSDPWRDDRVRVVRADPTRPGPWQEEVAAAAAVVNLAGAPIVEPPKRWTDERKRALRASRVETTRQIVAAIRAAPTAPRALVSASAIGYYGGRGDAVVDETTPAGDDFLARLAADWEAAALEAADVTRVALTRTGMVLGAGGGALAPLLPLFKLGLGGPWGDGTQWWSWIHLADEVGLICFLLDGDLAGPVNLTAPSPVTVREFAQTLGRVLGRPAVLRVPAPLLRLALGEAADALLELQRVVPRRAIEAGYRFQFPEIEGALRDLLGR